MNDYLTLGNTQQSYVQALWNSTAGTNGPSSPIQWTYSAPPVPDFGAQQRQQMLLNEAMKQMATQNLLKEEKPPMRGLFEVFVVDSRTDKVHGPYLVVATDEAKARLKALAKLGVEFDFDHVDVLCRRIGDVAAKKVVQEVRTVP